jgi:hypothetical protein
MRKIFTLALTICTLMGQAQLLTLTNAEQNVTYNEGVIDVWAAAADGQMELDVTCVLAAGAPKVINIRRYEVSLPAAPTENSFCWGECYNSVASGTHPTWYAPTTETLFPATPFAGFHGYYHPLGVEGTAVFRYVWFDDNLPTDSVWMDIAFHATGVGISESPAGVVRFDAFPVPSAGSAVGLTFDAPRSGQNAVVECRDALGQLVSTDRLRTGQQRFTLAEGRLPLGLWFVSLRVDGRVKATRRLVITAR